jgi:PAS domain S-box-containing protein
MAESETSASSQGRLRLCDFIRDHYARILEEWTREARLLPGVQGLSRPQLLDHLPELLERLANVVETVHTGEHRTLEDIPEVHALERLDAGFDLEQVASEYSLLRACILRLYSEYVGNRNTGVLIREMLRFNQTFDVAVVTAVARYARTRERTLVALDRLSKAALGTEDLDTFIPRLLRVILECTESVDSLTLLLREGDTLRVRAAVGLEEEVSTGFSLKVGEGFAGRVAAERRPKELRSACTDPLVKSPGLRSRGIQALYGVPLLNGEEVVGVAHMGSRTAHEFSNEDKLLFRVMLGRIAGLIVQAQLVVSERKALARVREQEARTRRLQEVTAALSCAHSPEQVARVVVDKAIRALGAASGSMGLLTPDGQYFELRGVTGYPPEVERDWSRFPADSPVMFREAVRTGALVLYETKESFLADHPQWVGHTMMEGYNAFATLPLRVEGRALGAVGLSFREPHAFSQEERDYMLVLAGQCAQALERARLYEAEQRARAEAQLALARLNLLMDTAPVGLGFWDKGLRYLRLNERLAEMNGVPMAAHLGRPLREVLPALAPTLEPLFHRVLETGQSLVDLEVRGETPQAPGVQRHWLVSYYPMRDVDGTPMGLGGVVVEITERKRAEEVLAQVDALVEASPAGLALLDTELRYVRINEALAATNGAPVEAHLGKTVAEVLPERMAGVQSVLRRVLDTGEAFRGREFSLAPANDPGVLHHWVGDYFPVRTRDGRVLGVGGVIMDITDRKRAEEELRRAAEFRERFLGIVSHDLRNPLNAILLSANALIRSEGIPERQMKSIRRIVTSAERMERMISELLDFTRGRLGGGIPISPRPTQLRHLCRHVLEELEAGHPGRQLRLKAQGDFQGEWDSDRLAQVLGNLGKNALQYSPEDTPVDFVLQDEGDSVSVEVHNAGAPIPADALSEVFEPFQRAVGEEHPGTSGLGLGLFIVQQIVAAHGGTVAVRSTEAEGTTFTVRLPRRRGDASAGP